MNYHAKDIEVCTKSLLSSSVECNVLRIVVHCSVVGEWTGDGYGGTRETAGSAASTTTSLLSADSDINDVPTVVILVHDLLIVVVKADWFALFHVIH